MKVPQQSKIHQDGTHRLIPYRYSDRGKPVLSRLAEDDDELLSDLTELEGATNDRLLGESGKLPGISAIELVSGFRLAHIVNAAFTHAHPLGARFNTGERGAWYASFDIETAQAEVAFHRSEELKEIRWTAEEISPYIDYVADFRYEFHDIREDHDLASCLDPKSYRAFQTIGAQLLSIGSAGIVYPSVRHTGGTCIVCFRPPLVLNVQEGPMVTLTFIDAKVAAVGTQE
jgi:RES domain-containing protein